MPVESGSFQEIKSARILLIASVPFMLDHLVMTNGHRRAHNLHARQAHSGSDVIVLSTPAPVLVREAIHLHVLVWGHRRHSTKVLWVRQPVSELVHGHRQVSGELFMAGVGVVVILRKQVDIMEEDAAPVFVSEGLPHAYIQQFGSVKSAIPPLLYNVDAVVDLLSLQERVEVVQQGTEVGLSVPIRYHYCCVVTGFTVWRPVVSTGQNQRVSLSDLFQRQRRGKMDRDRSNQQGGWDRAVSQRLSCGRNSSTGVARRWRRYS